MDKAPGLSKTMLPVLIIVTVISLAPAQLNLGPNNCLLYRLEYFPCTFNHPSTTDVPGQNESGTYLTKFHESNCIILRRKHKVEAIPVINADTEPIFTVSSPGFYQGPPQNYGNLQLVHYNISCKEGQYVFFNMTNFNLESANCLDPYDNINKCLDYVQVRLNNGLLVGENCGSDTTGVYEQILPFDSFKMVFRSNGAYRFPGFSATAICFDPGPKDSDGGVARKKRSLSSFNLGQPLVSPKAIEVLYGVDVVYEEHTLDFEERETGRIMLEKRLVNITIKSLYTFSMSGEVQQFRNKGYGTNYQVPIPNRLHGPGVLFLSKYRAYFQKFLIDTSDLIPTASELELIAMFVEAKQLLIPRTPANLEKYITTKVPTTVPTQYVTSAPSEGFTTAPTRYVTSVPSEGPTSVPTQYVTSVPSERTTTESTQYVTSSPSEGFTTAPTRYVTSVPSEGPTSVPTQYITSVPSERPTTVSTQYVTSVPSEGPTSVPTQYITSVPSERPTTVSTQYVTSVPSEGPTSVPTQYITSVPSETPTTVSTQYVSSAPRRRRFSGSDFFSLRHFRRDAPVLKKKKTDVLSDEVLTLSIQSTISSSPILKVAASSLVNELKKDNPGRLRKLEIQTFGVNNCLISRLDVVPCTFSNPRTRKPGPNEFGIYFTKFKIGRKGLLTCDILKRKHIIQPIESIGVTNKVFILHSPGITLETPKNYDNQLFVKYEVQCPENHLAFFNVTRLDMEPANCFNIQRNTTDCVDYVKLQRGAFGHTEFCGNDSSGNNYLLDTGSFEVILRTSSENRYPGFIAYVICFDPYTHDRMSFQPPVGSEGECCTTATNTTTKKKGSNKRRRRNLKDLIPDMDEKQLIATLMDAQLNRVKEDEQIRHSPNVLQSMPFNLLGLEPPLSSYNWKRKQVDGIRHIEDEVLTVALQNENASNPVLWAYANSLVQEAGRTDPDRVRMLRESLVRGIVLPFTEE